MSVCCGGGVYVDDHADGVYVALDSSRWMGDISGSQCPYFTKRAIHLGWLRSSVACVDEEVDIEIIKIVSELYNNLTKYAPTNKTQLPHTSHGRLQILHFQPLQTPLLPPLLQHLEERR